MADTPLDELISHRIGMERLGLGVLRQVMPALDDARKDVIDIIRNRILTESVRGPTRARVRQLEDAYNAINRAMLEGYAAMAQKLLAQLQGTAEHEAEWAHRFYGSFFGLKATDLTLPTAHTLAGAALAKPMSGKTVASWAKRMQKEHAAEVDRQLRLGVMQGESVEQMVSRLKGTDAFRNAGIFPRQSQAAEILVRTGVNHISNTAHDLYLRDNPKVFKQYRWLSVLDRRTSQICRSRAGNVYDVGEGPLPPAHPRCRSTVVGLPMDPATRRRVGPPMEDVSYETWLRSQPIDVQQDVLGPSRYALWQRGELALDRFVDYSGRSYTLPELKRREREAWETTFLTAEDRRGLDVMRRLNSLVAGAPIHMRPYAEVAQRAWDFLRFEGNRWLEAVAMNNRNIDPNLRWFIASLDFFTGKPTIAWASPWTTYYWRSSLTRGVRAGRELHMGAHPYSYFRQPRGLIVHPPARPVLREPDELPHLPPARRPIDGPWAPTPEPHPTEIYPPPPRPRLPVPERPEVPPELPGPTPIHPPERPAVPPEPPPTPSPAPRPAVPPETPDSIVIPPGQRPPSIPPAIPEVPPAGEPPPPVRPPGPTERLPAVGQVAPKDAWSPPRVVEEVKPPPEMQGPPELQGPPKPPAPSEPVLPGARSGEPTPNVPAITQDAKPPSNPRRMTVEEIEKKLDELLPKTGEPVTPEEVLPKLLDELKKGGHDGIAVVGPDGKTEIVISADSDKLRELAERLARARPAAPEPVAPPPAAETPPGTPQAPGIVTPPAETQRPRSLTRATEEAANRELERARQAAEEARAPAPSARPTASATPPPEAAAAASQPGSEEIRDLLSRLSEINAGLEGRAAIPRALVEDADLLQRLVMRTRLAEDMTVYRPLRWGNYALRAGESPARLNGVVMEAPGFTTVTGLEGFSFQAGARAGSGPVVGLRLRLQAGDQVLAGNAQAHEFVLPAGTRMRISGVARMRERDVPLAIRERYPAQGQEFWIADAELVRPGDAVSRAIVNERAAQERIVGQLLRHQLSDDSWDAVHHAPVPTFRYDTELKSQWPELGPDGVMRFGREHVASPRYDRQGRNIREPFGQPVRPEDSGGQSLYNRGLGQVVNRSGRARPLSDAFGDEIGRIGDRLTLDSPLTARIDSELANMREDRGLGIVADLRRGARRVRTALERGVTTDADPHRMLGLPRELVIGDRLEREEIAARNTAVLTARHNQVAHDVRSRIDIDIDALNAGNYNTVLGQAILNRDPVALARLSAFMTATGAHSTQYWLRRGFDATRAVRMADEMRNGHRLYAELVDAATHGKTKIQVDGILDLGVRFQYPTPSEANARAFEAWFALHNHPDPTWRRIVEYTMPDLDATMRQVVRARAREAYPDVWSPMLRVTHNRRIVEDARVPAGARVTAQLRAQQAARPIQEVFSARQPVPPAPQSAYDVARQRFYDHLEAGGSVSARSQARLARDLKVTRAEIEGLVREAQQAGWLQRHGRGLRVVAEANRPARPVGRPVVTPTEAMREAFYDYLEGRRGLSDGRFGSLSQAAMRDLRVDLGATPLQMNRLTLEAQEQGWLARDARGGLRRTWTRNNARPTEEARPPPRPSQSDVERIERRLGDPEATGPVEAPHTARPVFSQRPPTDAERYVEDQARGVSREAARGPEAFDKSVRPWSRVTAEDDDAIHAYSWDYAGPIQDYMRFGTDPAGQGMSKADLDEVIAEVKAIIARTELGRPYELFRGVDPDFMGLDRNNPQALVGQIVSDKSFASASVNLDTAFGYTISTHSSSYTGQPAVVMRFIGQKGDHAVAGEPSFGEIVYPPDTRFRVIGVRRVTREELAAMNGRPLVRDGVPDEVYIVDAEVVRPGGRSRLVIERPPPGEEQGRPGSQPPPAGPAPAPIAGATNQAAAREAVEATEAQLNDIAGDMRGLPVAEHVYARLPIRSESERVMVEQIWHNAHVTPEVERAIRGSEQVIVTQSDPTQPMYYDPVSGAVNSGPLDPYKPEDRIWFRHEFGHHLDMPVTPNGTIVQYSADAKFGLPKAMTADAERIMSAYKPDAPLTLTPEVAIARFRDAFGIDLTSISDRNIAHRIAEFGVTGNTAFMRQIDMALRSGAITDAGLRSQMSVFSDLVGAVTKSRLGVGHPRVYFESGFDIGSSYTSRHANEQFSNWFALHTHENPGWRNVLRQYMPDSTHAAQSILEQIGRDANGD
jgi:SPP1 gp7 family putative phage head morphogenesis protein